MKERYNDMDALIAKQLAGESDTAEDAALQNWLALSDDNKTYFQQLKQLWEIAPEARPQIARNFDAEAALQKVKQQITFRDRQAPRRTRRIWLQAAAAVAVLAVAVWFVHRPAPADGPVEIAGNTETILTDTLSDGSVVTLNRNSGLSVAKGFNKKERRMALRGEAYFEVAPNPEKPFVVTVEELEVKVVGTAFNVDNASVAGKVIISVTHGKVLVHSGDQSIYLTAGEQAEYDQQTRMITRLQPDQNPNALAYKSKVFRFEATPLSEVVRQLNLAYGTKISLSKNLENCQLTARYNNLGIGRVLDLVAASFSIKADKNADGSYTLSGQGCGE